MSLGINSQADERVVERCELTQSCRSCYSLLYILQNTSKLQPAQFRISCNSPCSDPKVCLTICNAGGIIDDSQSLSGRTREN